MKKISFVLALLFTVKVYAQNTKSIASVLQNVTVYSNGAELNHQAKVTVNAGTSEIIIGNISNSVDENSIQVGCNNDITIMSVLYRQEFSKTQKSPEITQAENALNNQKTEYNKTLNQISTYNNTLTLLDANKKVSGENTGLNVLELQKMVDYYVSKTQDIKTQLQTLADKQIKQKEELDRLQNTYNELINTNDKNKGEIVLQVVSNTATSATFNISYVSYTAAWSPMYDLKTNSTKSPLKIIYKANIVQNTGLDWKNVHLTISTANPSQTGTAPILSTWFLNYYQPMYGVQNNMYRNQVQSMAPRPTPMQAKKGNADESMDFKATESTVNQFTTTNETALNATFDIDLPYDIASDGKAHSVSMKDYDVPSNYKYYAVPKKDKDAFLIAEVSDWEKLNLVAGEANIIFDGTYVGKSYIDPSNTQDTLNISLGRDKKVVIKREKLVDFCSAKLIGSKKMHTITYEIKIKNTRKEAIDLLLKDQYPVSQNKDIEIELLQSDNAMVNEETGVLTWKLNLAAGETKKIRLSYSVKIPKDKVIGAL